MNFYIVGTSGSGKSTLARYLEKRFRLNHIELDQFSFGPHWEVRPVEDFVRDVEQEISKGPWVICGNYKEILSLALKDVDHLIWLDYGFFRIFWQVLKRTLRRLIKKEQCCGGNQETWHQQFLTKYSIFVWIFMTYRKNRRRFQSISKYSPYDHHVHRFTSPKDLDQFLKTL